MANPFDDLWDEIADISHMYDLQTAVVPWVAALAVLKFAWVSHPKCVYILTVLLLACLWAWLAKGKTAGEIIPLRLLFNCAVASNVVVLLHGWHPKSSLVLHGIVLPCVWVLITEEEDEDDEEIEETSVQEMCGLSQDLVHDILDRLPVKQLMRMKCLSKPWCSFISRYRLSRSRSTTSTLLCQYRLTPDKHHQLLFLHPTKEHGNRIIHKSCSYPLESGVKFMAHSNGMFLLSKYVAKEKKVIIYVNKPVMMTNPWDTLPPIHNCDVNYIGVGLAFDGASNHHYKVVCYFLDDDQVNATGCMEFQIFSSETREWRRYRERILNLSTLGLPLDKYSVSLHYPYLFWQGRMLCTVNNNMLVHHLQENTLEVLKLPKIAGFTCWDGLLWVSEGCLHYCCSYRRSGGFHVWKYVNDNLCNKSTPNSRSQGWKLKHTALIHRRVARNPKKYGPFEVIEDKQEVQWFKPCAFDEDLQVVYIQLPRSIVSYSFETRRLRRLWTLEGQHAIGSLYKTDCIHLNATNLPTGGDKLQLP